MPLVAGVDSSTQSCTVVVADADDGHVVRSGRAPHPAGTEVDPEAWWTALQTAIAEAGGIDDVAALSVAAQQHGMVVLDERGVVVRPALLWNDTRSARAAAALTAELGPTEWATATGSVPVASYTVTKLRWLAEHEPEHAARTAAVCLPHDWLTWRLTGSSGLADLTTDRGDASGTGYWSPAEDRYRLDILAHAFGRSIEVPAVVEPAATVGTIGSSSAIGPGTGDNMAAALGLGVEPGEVIVSIGTSGVVCAPTTTPSADPRGLVAGFADATGGHLPLTCTLNGAPVLAAVARMLGVDLDALAALALTAPAGADGVVFVPYLAGERTPNRPDATGALHGLTDANTSPATIARAAVEGLLNGLAAGLDALADVGVVGDRVLLTGGGASSRAVCEIAPAILGRPVDVIAPGDGVALGAARQAAWTLTGGRQPPRWPGPPRQRFDADPRPEVVERYREASASVIDRLDRAGPEGPAAQQR